MRAAHERSSADPECLRISLDTKAKVKIGDFSRGGSVRSAEPVKALDHDMSPEAVLVPAGILEVDTNQLSVVFGTSRGTSDFMADCLDLWWSKRSRVHAKIRRLQIDLDNGPEIASSRTQFMKRLVDFSDRTGLEVELVYYPPYHSKYNLIERCWGILEQHWNGTLLSTIETALSWAGTMTWRGIRPLIHLLDEVYNRGVKLTEIEFRPFAERLLRAEKLTKWSLTIKPHNG